MTSQELVDADTLLKGMNLALYTLQQEGRFPNYSIKTTPVKINPFTNAIEWRFYTWNGKSEIELDWKRIYPYLGEGIPMHHLQVATHQQFIEDLNDLMLQLIGKYPGVMDFVGNMLKTPANG